MSAIRAHIAQRQATMAAMASRPKIRPHDQRQEPLPGTCGEFGGRNKDGTYCDGPTEPGYERCRRHNMGSPAILNGKWKPGGGMKKYKNFIPKALRRHLDVVKCEEIASMRDEISLIDARTAQILEKLDTKEPVDVTKTAKENLIALTEAIDEDNEFGVKRALEELGKFLEHTEREANAWSEIRKNLMTRDQMARTEIQYQKMLSDNILHEHLVKYMAAVAEESKALASIESFLMMIEGFANKHLAGNEKALAEIADIKVASHIETRKKLKAFVGRVVEMTRGVAGIYQMVDTTIEGNREEAEVGGN